MLPITGVLIDALFLRILIEPTDCNSLIKPSQVMIDKMQTPAGGKLGPTFACSVPSW